MKIGDYVKFTEKTRYDEELTHYHKIIEIRHCDNFVVDAPYRDDDDETKVWFVIRYNKYVLYPKELIETQIGSIL